MDDLFGLATLPIVARCPLAVSVVVNNSPQFVFPSPQIGEGESAVGSDDVLLEDVAFFVSEL